jgi:hypothetical protein
MATRGLLQRWSASLVVDSEVTRSFVGRLFDP